MGSMQGSLSGMFGKSGDESNSKKLRAIFDPVYNATHESTRKAVADPLKLAQKVEKPVVPEVDTVEKTLPEVTPMPTKDDQSIKRARRRSSAAVGGGRASTIMKADRLGG